MILLVIMVIVAIWLVVRFQCAEDTLDKVFKAFCAIMAGFFALLIWIALGVAIESFSIHEYRFGEYDKVELVAIINTQSLEGSFGGNIFLIAGRVESTPYYIFYFKTPEGGKKLSKLRAESATIYEEKRTDAYMAQIKKKKVYATFDKRSGIFFPVMPLSGLSETGEYAIHVPEGTIKRELNLDLKDFGKQ